MKGREIDFVGGSIWETVLQENIPNDGTLGRRSAAPSSLSTSWSSHSLEQIKLPLGFSSGDEVFGSLLLPCQALSWDLSPECVQHLEP